jgi:2-polyprenyl-3-methyl-5-hydroxy-6-metoxy-1,4-benzoquinol methylase
LGLHTKNEASLKIFDDYYFNYYPYLKSQVALELLQDKTVLEIGLGFGTLSQHMHSQSKKYVGVDYSEKHV